MSAKSKKLAPKRTPVRGWMESFELSPQGAYVIRERRSKAAYIPVIIADSSAWEPVRRKCPAKVDSQPLAVKCFVYHDRIFFNANHNIVAFPESDQKYSSDTLCVLVDARVHRIIRKKDAKPLQKETPHGVPTPNKSHRMTKWRTEVRAPCGTPRFYAVRHCTRCGAEQAAHPAGRFSAPRLRAECNRNFYHEECEDD